MDRNPTRLVVAFCFFTDRIPNPGAPLPRTNASDFLAGNLGRNGEHGCITHAVLLTHWTDDFNPFRPDFPLLPIFCVPLLAATVPDTGPVWRMLSRSGKRPQFPYTFTPCRGDWSLQRGTEVIP